MDVVAQPGREFTFGSFADITPITVTAIDWAGPGRLRVTFNGTLTMAQQVAVQQRILSATVAEEEMRMKAAGYLTKPGVPTVDETHQQIRRLTRLLLGVDSKTLPGSNPSQDRA
jgi:hypothetical protein